MSQFSSFQSERDAKSVKERKKDTIIWQHGKAQNLLATVTHD